MGVVTKCLAFNVLDPTKVKQKALSETYQSYFSMVKEIRGHIKENVPTRKELHGATYSKFRGLGIPAQLVISARVYAWNNRRHKSPKKVTVRFDKRLHSFKKTKRGNPTLSVRCLESRICIPIVQDGAYAKLQEHLKEGWEVTSIIMTSKFCFYANLSREFEEPELMPNILGVDINSSKLAVSVVTQEGRVLRQLYFGRDIYLRQIHYEERRAEIMHHRDKEFSSTARKAYNKLSGKQRDFVRTRVWQIVTEIIELAKEYHATIAIEDLKHLRKRKGEWNKKSRMKVNLIPYGLFRCCIEHKATIEGVPLVAVEPKHTSQACPKCGHTSKSNWRGYSYFVCKHCGFEANRDRVASVNICHRASKLATPIAQIPMAGVAVNQPVRPNEVSSQHT